MGTPPPDFSFALTRNGLPLVRVTDVVAQAERPAISELQACAFVVDHRDLDTEYRITVGDSEAIDRAAQQQGVPAGGIVLGAQVVWPETLYFESARGQVACRLWSRPAESEDRWVTRSLLRVDVVPTKLGELRYLAMFEDLRALASGLIFDLVAKSSVGVGFVPRARSVAPRASHLELQLIDKAWREIGPALAEIDRSPATRLARSSVRRPLVSVHRLNARTVRDMVAQGANPADRRLAECATATTDELRERVDTPENRIVLSWLTFLQSRSRECLQSVDGHIAAIRADRIWRDQRLEAGPTLYESMDLPRLARLDRAREEGRRLRRALDHGARLPVLRGLAPLDAPATGPTFEHVRAYRRVRAGMVRYLRSSLVLIEDGGEERIKSTSRMYEQWVFLQLAAAIRSAGWMCRGVRGMVRQQGRHRFMLDLDRGTTVSFSGHGRHLLRLRYEPWILPERAARAAGDNVYRGREGETAWSPDVLLEILSGGAAGLLPTLQYAVVVDAKYTRRLDEDHWRRAGRYLEIRDVGTGRQVVKQLWLAYPGGTGGIVPRDPAVSWSDGGPDRPRDEVIIGALSFRPPEHVARDAPEWEMQPVDTAARYVTGLLRYLDSQAVICGGEAQSLPSATASGNQRATAQA